MTRPNPALFPVLDESKCDGHAACVAACPPRSLALASGRPWLARPADCVACGVCAAVCPTGAIRTPPPGEAADAPR